MMKTINKAGKTTSNVLKILAKVGGLLRRRRRQMI